MMAGATEEERRALSLPPADRTDSFHYLNQSGCYRVRNVDDKTEYAITRKAMDGVGMSREEQNSVFKVLSGILHLGNLSFRDDSGSHLRPLSCTPWRHRCCSASIREILSPHYRPKK